MEIESQEKLNIWAAISMSGKVGIYIYEGNLDSKTCRDILRDVLVPSTEELHHE